MKNKGWIAVWRKIEESEIWIQEPWRLKAWIYMLIKADHAGITKYGQRLERGQLLVNRIEDFNKEIRWKRGSVYKTPTVSATKHLWWWLRQASMVSTKRTTRGTIITILNYDKYQDKKTMVGTTVGTSEEPTQEPTVAYDRQQLKQLKQLNNTSSKEMSQAIQIKIINLFAYKKGVSLEAEDVRQNFVKRNIRAAVNLIGYDLSKIEATMDFLEANPSARGNKKWGLETVAKFVYEDLDKLKMDAKNQGGEFRCDFGYWHKKGEKCGHNRLFKKEERYGN